MKIKLLVFSFISVASFFFSCDNGSVKHAPYTDTPTSGEILILADESYEPLIQVQIDTFQEIYVKAKINVRYLPEEELFKQLMNNDTVRIAITARDLNAAERKDFEIRTIVPRNLRIASDGVALIVNPENTDTLLTTDQLQSILLGKYKTWKELSGSGIKDSIRVVFDKNGSANARYLKEKFLGEKSFPANSYATNSSAAVVDYVSKTKGAIGVIGVNWISDSDDSTTTSFLDKIRVVGISQKDSTGTQMEYYKPYQAYIALKTYPLIRDVMIVNIEGRSGLGTGFASFVAGDKGQRMIRLMGLLPATMPVRIIQVN
ncbi:MAG TPA: substrate-binding domain-containing protein [Bacteroidia bacterium]|jgi:phosphate transport system substrate-binding protein|nr:substrate-binding domain-containing protein [Bacteroidota bacterium]MBK8585508.1 substrate-binding domain-containing protein [Bacteroidota bacterium]HQV99034.1 substrate-binding domain-containing protein [Bacteroidia bacterium]HQW23015.1 substrate-binding domain-containing protein [Bacteroidia bacterium]